MSEKYFFIPEVRTSKISETYSFQNFTIVGISKKKRYSTRKSYGTSYLTGLIVLFGNNETSSFSISHSTLSLELKLLSYSCLENLFLKVVVPGTFKHCSYRTDLVDLFLKCRFSRVGEYLS